jgi:hypothetical protein
VKNRITATRLLVFLWALILHLAIPVLLVVPDEPEMTLVETDCRVDR